MHRGNIVAFGSPQGLIDGAQPIPVGDPKAFPGQPFFQRRGPMGFKGIDRASEFRVFMQTGLVPDGP